MKIFESLIRGFWVSGMLALLLCSGLLSAAEPPAQISATEPPLNFAAVRSAITDLAAAFGPRYPARADFLARLEQLEHASDLSPTERQRSFRALQREALLANPVLDFERLLIVRRVSRPLKASENLWTIDRGLPAGGGNGLNIGLLRRCRGHRAAGWRLLASAPSLAFWAALAGKRCLGLAVKGKHSPAQGGFG